MNAMRNPSLIFLLAFGLLTSTFVYGADSQTKTGQQTIASQATLERAKASATKTMQACMKWVQMNVFEFEECVDEQMRLPKQAKAERLGVSYMGFVGALSAQRFGSQGSQLLAWKYARQFNKIQRQLGLKDSDLCVIVAGDCDVRMARTAQILKGSKPKPLTEAELSAVHKH
jgi:hypothetical protein